MEVADILALMEKQVAVLKPDEDWPNLSSTPVTSVLTSSFEIMEFVMNVEDELELEDDIDLDALAPKLAQNITFETLAIEVKKFIDNLNA
ncbi:MAG: hypothetical protein ACO36I_21825 [Candidatus Latescibacterota bacterium]